jgi:beta-phosphoglucomutase-like phosphatase (HAD superfamily)
MSCEMNPAAVLALDFDGVICDSTEECIVTAWNAWREGRARAPQDVPEPYRSALRRERNYVRTAGEYLIVLETAAKGFVIGSQDEYDSLLDHFKPALAQFAEVFFNARNRLRAESERQWLDLHQIYAGIPEGLRQLTLICNIFVVTGKDRESVMLFFDRMKLPLADDHIYDKDAAVDKLQAIRKINAHYFIDDNINHLRPIHEAGFGALMAGWGYHTDEHVELAKRLGVPIVGLDNWVKTVQREMRLPIDSV